MSIGKLVQEAKKMEQKMREAQQELSTIFVLGKAGIGKSGNDLVTVEMNGRHDTRRVSIAPEAREGDHQVLEGLLAAAINDAVLKVEKIMKAKLSALTANVNFPASDDDD